MKPLNQNVIRNFLVICMSGSFLLGCQSQNPLPLSYPSVSTITKSPTFTPTFVFTTTSTVSVPQTYVFYGDSSLAIGDAGDGKEHVGYSFVSDLLLLMDPMHTLLLANYGGRTAKWAYEHIEEEVLSNKPQIVTLWWGFDDLGGCPGIFDRETNKLLDYRLNALIDDHVKYLGLMIDLLVDQNISVISLTPIPVLQGKLPWSHLNDKNQIVWEEGRWCDFNIGLEELAQSQRNVLLTYKSEDKPVFIVDVWQLYIDNPDMDKMYMDVVHPASNGAKLIADEWYRVYKKEIRDK